VFKLGGFIGGSKNDIAPVGFSDISATAGICLILYGLGVSFLAV
jgi:hypothetical protein